MKGITQQTQGCVEMQMNQDNYAAAFYFERLDAKFNTCSPSKKRTLEINPDGAIDIDNLLLIAIENHTPQGSNKMLKIKRCHQRRSILHPVASHTMIDHTNCLDPAKLDQAIYLPATLNKHEQTSGSQLDQKQCHAACVVTHKMRKQSHQSLKIRCHVTTQRHLIHQLSTENKPAYDQAQDHRQLRAPC
jgi:hypothetical protein